MEERQTLVALALACLELGDVAAAADHVASVLPPLLAATGVPASPDGPIEPSGSGGHGAGGGGRDGGARARIAPSEGEARVEGGEQTQKLLADTLVISARVKLHLVGCPHRPLVPAAWERLHGSRDLQQST